MSKQELAMLIEKLRDCSAALERLAEHLQGAAQEEAAENDSATVDIALEVEVNAPLKVNDTADNIDNVVENAVENVINDVIEVAAEEMEDAPAKTAQSQNEAPQAAQSTRPGGNVQASANNPFARLFAGLNVNNNGVPNGANPFNLLNMLAGGKGGLPGLGGLPGMPGLTNNLPTTLTELHDNPQLMNMLSQVANNPQSLNMISGITGQSPEALQAALNSLQAGATPAATPMATPTIATTPAPTLPPIATTQAVTPTATAHLDSLLAEWHWGPYARVWTR